MSIYGKPLLTGAKVDSASGPIAHWTDGVDAPLKSLLVNIDPVQDLHGYDSPWPAGGGKNKIPYPYYSQDGALSGVTFSTAQDGKITASGTTTEGVNFFLARDISLAAGTYTLSIDGTHTALSLLARNPDAGITLATIAPSQATATFTLAEAANVRLYFNTSSVGVSVSISAYVQLEAGSTATAYAPYSNLCPITGWTGCDVTRAGRNLLKLDSSEMLSDGLNRLFPIQLNAGTYIISCQNQFGHESTKGAKIDLVDADKNPLINIVSAYNFGDSVFTGSAVAISADIAQKAKYIRFNLRGGGVTYAQIAVGNIQLELGSTATAYTPYTGTQYTIQLGDTVYGGTLDVTNGVLTVDRAMVDLGDINWNVDSNRPGVFYGSISERLSASFISMCSEYEVYNNYVTTSKDAYISGRTSYGANTIFVRDTRYATLTGAEYKVASAGITAVYELATPIEYTLTPQQISSLVGENNVWADTGDVTIEYLKRSLTYIS